MEILFQKKKEDCSQKIEPMQYLSLQETKQILLEQYKDYDIGIIKDAIIDFKWGTLFYIQSKEFIETGKNAITGISPILVDKIDGSMHHIDYLKIRDQELESYRIKKGYEHCIKFPVTADLSKMTTLEKVLTLFRTTEIVQIREAMSIVEKHNLFDLEGLGHLLGKSRYGNLENAISHTFNSIDKEIICYEAPIRSLPKEIFLFKDHIESIWITRSQIEEIPNEILELKKLRSLVVELTPLKKMPFDLRQLEHLERIELIGTNLLEQDLDKLEVPPKCKIEFVAIDK